MPSRVRRSSSHCSQSGLPFAKDALNGSCWPVALVGGPAPCWRGPASALSENVTAAEGRPAPGTGAEGRLCRTSLPFLRPGSPDGSSTCGLRTSGARRSAGGHDPFLPLPAQGRRIPSEQEAAVRAGAPAEPTAGRKLLTSPTNQARNPARRGSGHGQALIGRRSFLILQGGPTATSARTCKPRLVGGVSGRRLMRDQQGVRC
jgi:hypothetical protein